MFTLYKKEVSSFLNSLLGYIVIAVFLLVNGLFLWVFPLESNIPNFGYANLDGLFTLAPFVFLFLIPAITMRFFAEEKKSGTLELLMTKPLTDLQVILAKYFAGVTLVLVSLIPTLVIFIRSINWVFRREILTPVEYGVRISDCCFWALPLFPSACLLHPLPTIKLFPLFWERSCADLFTSDLNSYTTSTCSGILTCSLKTLASVRIMPT
jgi:hypothetical protein